MSGTSLDGIDLVHVKFQFDTTWSFDILHSETVEYGLKWQNTLANLVNCSLKELHEIDENYTAYLAIIIKNFI